MEKWYCVSGEDGRIHALGEHDCFDSAENAAIDSNLGPVWTFGEETFQDWRDTLTSMKGV